MQQGTGWGSYPQRRQTSHCFLLILLGKFGSLFARQRPHPFPGITVRRDFLTINSPYGADSSLNKLLLLLLGGIFFTFNFTSHKSNTLWRQKTVRRSSKSNGADDTRIIEKIVSPPCCSFDDWQFTCYCLISFFGLLRCSDDIQLRVQDFQFKQGNLVIFLNSSKTDQFRAGSNIFLSNNINDACLCPVTTARAFLSLFLCLEILSPLTADGNS